MSYVEKYMYLMALEAEKGRGEGLAWECQMGKGLEVKNVVRKGSQRR